MNSFIPLRGRKLPAASWVPPRPRAFQGSCAYGSHALNSRRGAESSAVPRIVHDTVNSPGQPLDAATLGFAESRFGHDFGQVRVHTGERAAASARAVNARAYTVGYDVVLGKGQFVPGMDKGRRLLTHELAHVIQQTQPAREPGDERQAKWAEGRVDQNRTVAGESLGSVASGIQRQESGDEEQPTAPEEPEETSPVRLTWPEAYELGGTPTFGGGPILFPPPPFFPGGPIGPSPELDVEPSEVIGPPEQDGEGGAGTKAPSRLSLISAGSFSFGLRLGFPPLEKPEGAPPSALDESLAQAELINQTLTGEVPSSWEALDKAELAGWAWGVFSKYISPETARSITESLSGSTGEGGLSYELDAVLFTDFSGGGLSFQLMF